MKRSQILFQINSIQVSQDIFIPLGIDDGYKA